MSEVKLKTWSVQKLQKKEDATKAEPQSYEE